MEIVTVKNLKCTEKEKVFFNSMYHELASVICSDTLAICNNCPYHIEKTCMMDIVQKAFNDKIIVAQEEQNGNN